MTNTIFQLKIILIDSKPTIWRRIQIDANTLLTDLHKIIQSSIGWTNSHLHQFTKSRILFALPSEDDFEEPEIVEYDHGRIEKTSLYRDDDSIGSSPRTPTIQPCNAMFQGCVRLKTHSTHTIVEIRLAFLLAYERGKKGRRSRWNIRWW